MNSENRRCGRRSEAGATALFFVSVLLPLLFLLFSIALDVSTYFRAQQQAQLALDEAAMQATRFLPFTSLAQGAATTFLDRYGELLQGTVVEVESDRVLLSLRKDVPITFAQFFLPGVGIPLESYASARVVPSDIYLAMDSSRLVGPGTPQETEAFLETFQAATFFEYDLPSAPDNPNQGARYRTALCFNPLFSTVKRAAIEIHEYLAGFRFNAVGVGIFPAPEGLLDIRPFSLTSSLMESGMPEGLFPVGLVYDRITAEWCAAAASFERVSSEYYFPLRQSGIRQLVSIDAPGENIIDASTYTFNPNYAPAVSLIEALWSVPVQKTEPQSDVVLGQMLSRIAGANFSARGGVRNAAHRVGILLSADVPWAVVPDGAGGLVSRRFGSDSQVEAQIGQALSAYRTLAAQSQLSQIDLFYAVLTNAQSQAAVEGQREALEAFFERSRSDPATGAVQENFNARLILASSAEEMRRRIATALVLSGKNVVLSK